MTERAEKTKRAYENGEPVLALDLTNLVTEEYEEKKAEEYAKGRAHEHYRYIFEENNGHPIDFARICYLDGRKDYRKEQEKKDIGFCEEIERQQEEIARLKEEIIRLKKNFKLEIHTHNYQEDALRYCLESLTLMSTEEIERVVSEAKQNFAEC